MKNLYRLSLALLLSLGFGGFANNVYAAAEGRGTIRQRFEVYLRSGERYFRPRLLAALQREELHDRLMSALINYNHSQVIAALRAGANVNDEDAIGRTPLFFVSLYPYDPSMVQIAQTLLNQPGIKINESNMRGETPTGEVFKWIGDPVALQIGRMFIAAGGRATDAEVRKLKPEDRERYLALVAEAEAQDLPPAYEEVMAGGRPGMVEEERKEAAQAGGVGAPGGPGWRQAMPEEQPREAAGVACPVCTFVNKPGGVQCELCDTPFMAGPAVAGAR